MGLEFNTTMVAIIVVIAVSAYLIYSQSVSNKEKLNKLAPRRHSAKKCAECESYKRRLSEIMSETRSPSEHQRHADPLSILHQHTDSRDIIGYGSSSEYVDSIKKMDEDKMYDHLSYPNLRLNRDVLEKYDDYREKTGKYPPFNELTQPIFDTPILNGLLIKHVEENEPFGDSIPSTIPLFKLKSVKNNNRYFYYILDQRYTSKLELKIPLVNVKINNVRFANSDFSGLPELYDGDIVENIPSFTGAKFKVFLYKTHHFP